MTQFTNKLSYFSDLSSPVKHNDNTLAKQNSIWWWCRVVHQLLCGITVTLLMFTIVWQDGRRPLMVASLKGHVQVVAELLQHRAKVDLQTKV